MSPERLSAYIASPLGFTAAGRHWYAEVLLPALAPVVEAVDPWALSSADEVATAAAEGRAAAFAVEIGRRNLAAIERADRLVAILDGQEVDSGTAAEVGWASARGKRCDGLRTDWRQSGEPAVAVNLQVVTCIEVSGGRILAELDELIRTLAGG